MAMPLLTTKLYVPPVQLGLVSRPRLIEQLNSGLHRKLTLISAPAGFGKTTLLSKWARGGNQRPSSIEEGSPPLCVAWLSLDEGDNDAARFLTYFIAALQRIKEDLGHAALDALQAPRPAPIKELLAALINEIVKLADDPFPDSRCRLALILDDYHVIEAQPIHDALAFLLEHLPPQMHLIIASRTDPPLPIARLRGQGQVTELRQADLCFTADEASDFLNQVMDLELTAEEVAALSARTEGWIAGLQMAAVSMQGRKDIGRFIQAFTGSDRFIMDYLVEEVLHRQPEEIQAFLLQTAILDGLTGPLCDAIVTTRQMGRSTNGRITPPTSLADLPFVACSGQEILEHLERANLFVVPLDDHRQWYRYHHLFAGLLRQRLHQIRPDLVPALHLRASKWLERNGLMAGAIDHALAAEDLERATDLIEQVAEMTWMRSEIGTFLGWVEALPVDMVRARPMLGIYHALALLMGGRPRDVVESCLQGTATSGKAAPSQKVAASWKAGQPKDSAEDSATDPVSGGMMVYHALVAAYQGKARQSTKLAQQALGMLPEENLFLRSLVAGILGYACMYSGDIASATEALEEAARVGQEAGNVMNTVLALCHLAELSMLQGQLNQARMRYQQALELAVDEGGQRLPIAGMALVGLGQLLLEQYDLDKAIRHLGQGIELTSKWGDAGTLQGYTALARAKQAQGDMVGAREHLQTAEQIAIQFDVMEIDDINVAMHHARLWIAKGNLEAAVRWAEERGLARDASLAALELKDGDHSWAHRYMRQLEYITLARLLIATGRQQRDPSAHTGPWQPDRSLEEATALLEFLLQHAEAQGQVLTLIDILVLRALACRAQGDLDQAVLSLERALVLGGPEGFIRIFVEPGEPMAELLHKVAFRGTTPEYTNKLLSALNQVQKDNRQAGTQGRAIASLPSSTISGPPSSLVEPLSERELEVLGLLTTSLSSTEMAERLIISVNTVRSHIRNIYGKLDVHSRFEAIARAQELSLL